MAEVVIAQPRVAQYRVPLFGHLRRILASRGIELRVLYGDAKPDERLRRDEGDLPWGEPLRTRRLALGSGSIVWLPILPSARQADMVIVPEFAGWLPTYELLVRRVCNTQIIACWGHGPDDDDHAVSRLSRGARRLLARRFDWWFSYTLGTTERLLRVSVPCERITTLRNTIDVLDLRSQIGLVRAESTVVTDGVGVSGPTALFLGALRENKRIDLVLDIGERVADRIQGFTLIVGGDGPLRSLVQSKTNTSPWLRYVGPVFGKEKARLLASADVMIQPAWLGLVVVDAFAAGLPIVTFDSSNHSPEHEYLDDGVQGVRVPGADTEAFAEEVVGLLEDRVRQHRMSEAAWEAGSALTVEAMAERFAEGIETALRSMRRWR